jgi:membrane-associated protein
MDISYLVELVQRFGYFSMFLFNWLLLFGLPIPNEVAASFSGVLTELNDFHPVYAFITAYLGLMTATMFAFIIGRKLGPKFIQKLELTRFGKPIKAFGPFLEKHGYKAISFSFFLPGIRWAMPYVVGAKGYPVISFLKYSLISGFVWMLIYFQLGRAFPYAYGMILENVRIVLVVISVSIVLILSISYFRSQRKIYNK